jgi:POT family proton-dependent oligopeptide transporter
MVLGLIQYRLGFKRLGNAGTREIDPAERSRAIRLLATAIGVISAVAIIMALLHTRGTLTLTPLNVAQGMGFFIPIIVVVYFSYQLFMGGFDSTEKKRIGVIFVLFVAAALFWAGYEQAGSSMNLFAEEYTKRVFFGWEMPTSWLQSVNPIFIIAFSPLFGILWLALGSRQPSIPVKFALGLMQLGAGFLVLAWGSVYVGDVSNPHKVTSAWLVVTYFLHTTGELCLSPVGLSSMTKLSPRKLVGQMMGIWFMASAFGNLMAGLLAGKMESLGLVQLFNYVALATIGAGIVLLIFSRPVKKLIGDVQ